MDIKNFNFPKYLIECKIHLSPTIMHACIEGINQMKLSQDAIHDENHVYGLLLNLQKFIRESNEVRWKKINFEILILSICWHDVWKSRRLTMAGHKLILHQIYEGLGSMRIFSGQAKKLKIDPYIAKKVKYALRKHSMLQFLPIRNVETRILKDMDKLDEWSSTRLKHVIGSYMDFNLFSPKNIRIYKFYFKHLMFRRTKCYFNWSKIQIEKKKPEMYQAIVDLFKEIAVQNVNPQPRPF